MGHDEGLVPGRRIDSLTIERELGRGAFGVVYLARDTLLGRAVALKEMRVREEADARERDRALREARLVGALQSPHIVTLHRVLPHPQGGWLFEMEYLDEGSLRDELAGDAPLATSRVRTVLRAILHGLRDAHENGVVHGDIKPANILRGSGGTIKLADFGLARLATGFGDESVTAAVVGTPQYMSPEVAMGEPPTAASDLWSTGVVLYRMLEGRYPFPASTLPGLFYGIQNTPPAPPRASTDGALARLALTCLAKQPEDRPRSCAALLEQVEQLPAAPSAPMPGVPIPGAVAEAGRPLLGREREIERLDDLLTTTARGDGRTVLLLGEGGIGKSALLRSTAARARARGIRSLEASLTPLEGLVRPLVRAVQAELQRSDPAWAARVAGEGEDAVDVVLRRLLAPSASVDEHSMVQAVFALERTLLALARERPLALLLDDAQGSSADDTALLRELARRLSRGPVLLVLAYRVRDSRASDEEAPHRSLAVLENVESIELAPLAGESVYALLEEETAPVRLDPAVAGRVVAISDGNPRLAIELLQHLRESDGVREKDGMLTPGPPFGAAGSPRRFRQPALGAIAGLDENERAILDVAAVDGREFDGEAIAAVLERPLLRVLRSLQKLTRRRSLVVPQAQGYSFTTPVLQRVLYEELAPDFRSILHRRLARHLEERVAPDPERVGLHWERAGEPGRARPHLVEAARAAEKRQELRRTIDLCARAGLVPGRIDGETARRDARVLFGLAACLSDTARHEEAMQVFDALRAAAEDAGDEELGLRTAARRARFGYPVKGAAAVDETLLRRAAEALPSCAERLMARYTLGLVAKYRGELGDAETWLRSAEALGRELGNAAMLSSCLDQLAALARRQGRPHEAEQLYADAARVSADAGRRTNAAISEVNRALVAFTRGALDGLEQDLQRSIRALALEGAVSWAAQAGIVLAHLKYANGDLAGAAVEADRCLRSLTGTRSLPGIASAHLDCGQFAAYRGDLHEAERHLQAAKDANLKQANLASGLAWAAAVTAECRCFAGDFEGAVGSAEEALARIGGDPSGYPGDEVICWLAESVLFGLPQTVLRDVDVAHDAGVGGERASAAALLQGARAYVDPRGSPDALRAAARVLRGAGIGEHRASRRIVAAWLEAEAWRRAGVPEEAVESARAALGQADALGHVWLQAALLRVLRRWTGDSQLDARLADIVGRSAERLPSEQSRRLLRDAWL